jgi:hypothetical protein
MTIRFQHFDLALFKIILMSLENSNELHTHVAQHCLRWV